MELYSKGRAITARITGRLAVLTSTFKNVLGRSGTLRLEPIRGSERAASRLARSVAFAIGISLSIPMQAVDAGSIEAINPKAYIRLHYSQKQALCLIKLYGKESAFKTSAVGNLKGSKQTFGIPQLKNPIIKDLSANKQIDYGMKYINHRYEGKPCLAWKHWIKKGWH